MQKTTSNTSSKLLWASRVLCDEDKKSFGWHVGDKVSYTYRYYNGGSHGYAHGTVTAVHKGTTRHNTTVSIRPDTGFRFGEGIITRHIDKIRHRR